jgi:hypothetical protein
MVYERVQRPVIEEDATTQPPPLTNYRMQKLFGEYVVGRIRSVTNYVTVGRSPP